MAIAVARRRNFLSIVSERLNPASPRAAEDREKVTALADVEVFAGHAWILHPTDGPMPFVPWSWQPQLLALWVIHRLAVVLKARQLGVSWLAAIYALWFAIRRPGQVVLLISQRQDDADKLLEKVAFVYERLPAWRPKADVSTRTIRFPGLGSEIESLPATERVGRSRTASLVVLDEHAHQPFARKILLALKPVAEKGQILSISSGNGQGALHSQLYLGAKAGTNGWRAIFIPASAHPERRAPDWNERNRAELSQLSDAEYAQEYPENDIEAIVTTGRPVFNHQDLMRQPLEAGVPGEPGVTYYREPEAGHVYVIGADVGAGLATSDWSSATVLERDSGEQVAQLRGRWTPDVFATKLDALARRFARHSDPANAHPVLLGVERNNHGHAVLLALTKLHAGTAPYRIFRAKDKRLGWLTTSATRPVLIDQLEEALRTKALMIRDAGTVDQMSTFAYSDDGRPEAQEGYHDDDVMAAGIAVQLRRRAFGRMLDIRQAETVAA